MSYLAEKIRSWTFAFTFKPDSSAYKFYIDATNFSLKQIETTIRSFNPEKKKLMLILRFVQKSASKRAKVKIFFVSFYLCDTSRSCARVVSINVRNYVLLYPLEER